MRPDSRPDRSRLARPAAAVLAVLVSLSACSLGPAYVKPTSEVPTAYKDTKGWAVATPADTSLRGDWWALFHDATLDQLEARVDVSNQTLAAAKARYEQARAQIGLARSAGLPQLNGQASANRARVSGDVTGRSLSGHTSNDFSLPLAASWEPDIFGRIGKTVEASQAGAEASADDVESVRLALNAELASDYFQVRSLDTETELLRQTVIGYQRALTMISERTRVGIASAFEVAQARTQLETAQAQQIDLAQSRAQYEHAIATLIGRAASDFTLAPVASTRPMGRAPMTAHTAPEPSLVVPVQAPIAIPVGLPSTLLERRPDVAAAERRVAGANARVGVARAAFFPSLTLGGQGGLESASLASLLSAPARFWSLGPLLAIPIFDGGARRARSDDAQAAYDAAVADYRHSVLAAFQEVEDSLSALRVLSDESTVQDRAVAAARQALSLALDRYRIGATAYLDVVISQTAALASERVALDLSRRRLLASVLLIKAVGGGWQSPCEAPTFTGSCS